MKGKYTKRRGVATKTMVMVLALVLVIGISVGGTLAWLTAQTGEVKNTFTVGDIIISLTETWNTDKDGDKTNDSWTGKMVPGAILDKDPKVTVDAGSATAAQQRRLARSRTVLWKASIPSSSWTLSTTLASVELAGIAAMKSSDKQTINAKARYICSSLFWVISYGFCG